MDKRFLLPWPQPKEQDHWDHSGNLHQEVASYHPAASPEKKAPLLLKLSIAKTLRLLEPYIVKAEGDDIVNRIINFGLNAFDRLQLKLPKGEVSIRIDDLLFPAVVQAFVLSARLPNSVKVFATVILDRQTEILEQEILHASQNGKVANPNYISVGLEFMKNILISWAEKSPQSAIEVANWIKMLNRYTSIDRPNPESPQDTIFLKNCSILLSSSFNPLLFMMYGERDFLVNPMSSWSQMFAVLIDEDLDDLISVAQENLLYNNWRRMDDEVETADLSDFLDETEV